MAFGLWIEETKEAAAHVEVGQALEVGFFDGVSVSFNAVVDVDVERGLFGHWPESRGKEDLFFQSCLFSFPGFAVGIGCGREFGVGVREVLPSGVHGGSLLFYRRRGAEVFFQAFCVEFFPAVIGVDAVLFLFDVGELGVAIPRDVGVVEEYCCEFFDAVIHFFYVCGAFAIAPAAFAVCGLFCFDGVGIPPGAAVFIDDIGLAPIGRAQFGEADGGVFPVVGGYGCVSCFEFDGVLFVVVYGVDVRADVYVAAGVVTGARGIECSGEVVGFLYGSAVRFKVVGRAAPGFVIGGPCEDRGMVEVALDDFSPFALLVVYGLG